MGVAGSRRETDLSSTFLINKKRAPVPFVSSTYEVEDAVTAKVSDLADRAATALEQGDFAKAEGLLRKGLETIPEHPRCMAYLAVCIAALGRRDGSAEKAARSVISRFPEEPAGWFALGQVHLLEGNRKVAFQHFAKARELTDQQDSLQDRLDKNEPRRGPVFASLSRDHFLNVFFGRVWSLFRRPAGR